MSAHFAAETGHGTSANPSSGNIFLHAEITDGLKAAIGRSILVKIEPQTLVSLLGFAVQYDRKHLIEQIRLASPPNNWMNLADLNRHAALRAFADSLAEMEA